MNASQGAKGGEVFKILTFDHQIYVLRREIYISFLGLQEI